MAKRFITTPTAVLLLLQMLATSCSQPDVSKLPPELRVIEGAKNIRIAINALGSTEVHYTVEGTAFNALGTRSLIDSHLQELGWTRLTRDWLNPSATLDWEFSTFTDARKSPNTRVHQWFGQWTNGKDEVVLYDLRYQSALSEDLLAPPDNARLIVTAIYAVEKEVRGMRRDIKEPLQ